MISERIKLLRENNKLTQSDLSKKLKITRSSINAWEMGISVPSTQMLVELSSIFHVSTDFLLGLSNTSTIDVSGLTDKDTALIVDIITNMREKNARIGIIK